VKSVCLIHVFDWHKQVSESKESVKDDNCPGHPHTHTHTPVTTNSTEKVWDVIWKDLRLGIWAMAEMVNFDRGSVWQILTDKLNMKKVCAKVVTKMLSAK